MNIFVLFALVGFIIDLLVGDPPRLPHPVVYIGRGIARLEKVARSVASSPLALKAAGVGIAITVVVVSFGVTMLILWAARQASYYVYLFLGAWIVSTTLATRGLAEAAGTIRQLLLADDQQVARRQVGYIVGRDTESMDREQMVRATVETVAENINDAVVAPLFYACLGGPALAMAYRAINTLDSMLGYKNDRYLYLGWASARLDDWAGYIPARLTGLVLLLAAWLSGRDWKRALRAWRRDAAGHPSPNSGIPESVMAGAIHVRLGGCNIYDGVASFRTYMGDPLEEFRPDHIVRAVDMLYLSSTCAVICLVVLAWLVIN
ncbi:adenosylcobinamide-phosphate synthase CbiB [Desulfallas thermosapovorans]|uniref:Cobalamin biosynthesis protein CobD n=1 Tax=Desulfallas thermosapovorans DSM 6562 TaxID=1121431 RepID=A0A5S4ZXN2_9FIRM|nr:adenosylcobinamide-phosphate synthase CbiB [Desulfallas thermosapovorans]TYO97844.1 adenosylcobinamide-phosphate synthase [Desulfallas thermosapovorans DSM 6562]